MKIQALLLTALFGVCAANTDTSSYADQITSLLASPTTVLGAADRMQRTENRALFYHSITGGGIAVDIYKKISNEIDFENPRLLHRTDIPGIYDGIDQLIPADIQQQYPVHLFLVDNTDFNGQALDFRDIGGALALDQHTLTTYTNTEIENLVALRYMVCFMGSLIKSTSPNDMTPKERVAYCVTQLKRTGFTPDTLLTTLRNSRDLFERAELFVVETVYRGRLASLAALQEQGYAMDEREKRVSEYQKGLKQKTEDITKTYKEATPETVYNVVAQELIEPYCN